MNSLVHESINVSDYYLIPTRAEYLSVEGVGQAIEYVKRIVSNNRNINPIFLGDHLHTFKYLIIANNLIIKFTIIHGRSRENNNIFKFSINNSTIFHDRYIT